MTDGRDDGEGDDMPERWINRLRGLAFRFRAVLRPGSAWRDLDDEMRFHIEMETRRLRREGVPGPGGTAARDGPLRGGPSLQ